MADEVKQDVSQESSSALGEVIASTPEVQEEAQEAQVSEASTPQKDVNQEPNVPFNEHPRFKELIEERNWYRQQLERQQQFQSQPQQPETLPEEIGSTPEEREFWRLQRRVAREEAEKIQKRVSPMLDAGARELASIKVQQFRSAHSDVKPGSPEEIQIAQKINQGYLPEDAYRSVMWDRRVEQAEKQANSNVKQKIEAKKQANVEQHSIPNGAKPPVNEKIPLRKRIEKIAADMEF